jgi:hypothetical protein
MRCSAIDISGFKGNILRPSSGKSCHLYLKHEGGTCLRNVPNDLP